MRTHTLGLVAALVITTAMVLPAADNPVTIAIDPNTGRAAISPFIYGTNQDLAGARVTSRRYGGNRTTGYNWENNASNAGSDYFHQSDNYLTWVVGIPDSQANVPGIALTHFHDASLALQAPYSIVTLPMAGYVARDKAGPVSTAEVAPSSRWVAVRNTKGSAFSLTPDTADNFVYNDELLNFLVNRYGPGTGATGIRAYNLDNEPDLWSHTHARLHPAQPTCVELITRSVDLAKTIRRIDATAEVLGFVSYGFNGYYSYQDAPDWPTERTKGNYRWFLDYYLDQMKKASDTAGQRLLDVVDLHNYTEHIAGGVRVNEPSEWSNIACNLGRMQAPRSYWDPTFIENSWIGQYQSAFLPFLPNMRAAIDTFYPGTKLALTEYNFGGESHISGGIAQADTLGIFGRERVYLANWWQLHDNPTYIAAAFKLYRDHDGTGGEFGDISVSATISDRVNGSVYASVDSGDADKLHVVLLNKSDTQPAAATFTITGPRVYTSGRVWAFDAASANLTERAAITSITGNTFNYTLPVLTAAHLVLQAEAEPPAITVQPAAVNIAAGARVVFSVVATGAGPITYQWRKNSVALTGQTGSSLTLPAISPADAATYSVVVTNAGGSTTSSDAALTLAGGSYVPPPNAIVNLSTRGQVGAVDQVLIAGFFVGDTGSGAKRLLLRAVGPTLAQAPFNVPGALADPIITLTTPGGTVLATNDDWGDNQNLADIAAATTATGAFAIPSGSKDAVLLVELPPGGYTLIVRGALGGTGVAIAELYDADPASAARLVNISTRAPVGSGAAVMIPGFVVQGATPATLLLRAIGPTLGPPPFNVPGVLADPQIELIPQGGSVIASNDNWGNDPAIAAAALQVGAFALPAASLDAALLRTTTAGAYTVLTTGVGGATGVALAEVYLVP